MRKCVTHKLLVCVAMLCSATSFAQSGLTIQEGTSLFISNGTAFSVDSLVLTASSSITLSGANKISQSAAATHFYSGTTVARSYLFQNPIPPFSGTISIYYRDEELAGLSEDALMLHVHDGSAWNTIASNVTRDVSNNLVTTTGLNGVSINELLLAEACATKTTYYPDNDGDGFGNRTISLLACTAPAGYVTDGSDCDDSKWLYTDADGDGFGAGAAVACGVANNRDCDDRNAQLNPATVWYLDGDGDGYYTGSGVASCTSPGAGYRYTGLIGGGDCNDNNAGSNPGKSEICGNGIDDNCNGLVDENCGICANATLLTTTNTTATSATLNWVASVNPVAWQLQYKTTATGAKWIDVAGVSPSARSVTISGLKAKQTYNWHIRAKCTKTWTSYSNAVSFKTTATTLRVNTITETQPAINETGALHVQVLPNPSSSYFTLVIRSANTRAITMRIFDAVGRTVEGKSGINSNSTQRIGFNYKPGVYYAQIIQQNKAITMKLVKE